MQSVYHNYLQQSHKIAKLKPKFFGCKILGRKIPKLKPMFLCAPLQQKIQYDSPKYCGDTKPKYTGFFGQISNFNR